MTTATASKAGLRANAAAKREKAAQKTPLPPKASAAPAQEIVEEAKPVAKRVPRKPASAATDPAKPAERVLAEKAKIVPIGAKSAPPRGTKAHQDAQIEAGQERKRQRRAAEETPVEAVPEELKGSKASRYADEFSKLGWVPGVTRLDGLAELVARRGDEAIYLAWMREAHVSGTSTYTIADRTVKVRNPAEAMRIAARQPDEAKASQAKVSSNLQFRRKATGPTIRSIPFLAATATDQEIIDAIESRKISWHNQYRVESETATVGRSKAITIADHQDGHRIVSFVDPEFGFRAFRLDHLENVGRKIDLERIRQQIIASLSKESKKSKAS